MMTSVPRVRSPAAGAGGAVAILSLAALLRFAERLLAARTGGLEPLFPSP